MSDTILIIGTRAIAAVLGVGRNRLLSWLANPEMGLPASNLILPGRWVATRQNLIDWSNSYFIPQNQMTDCQPGQVDLKNKSAGLRKPLAGPKDNAACTVGLLDAPSSVGRAIKRPSSPKKHGQFCS